MITTNLPHTLKRWAAALLTLAMLLSCLGTGGFAASSYAQETVEQTLRTAMAQYCGTYWTATYQGASQCKGFADMNFNTLFGTGGPGPYSDSRYELPDASARSCTCLGVLTPADCNPDSIRALLEQAMPGDYVQCVRYTGNQHSMLVVEVLLTGVRFFDCNLRGSALCASYVYTWEELGKYLTRGVSLYRHNGYQPTGETRLYFDADGGECTTAYKAVPTGEHYGALPTPTREGYRFDYWYRTAYTSSRTPTQTPVDAKTINDSYANTHLTAHWSQDEGPCAAGHSWMNTESVPATCETDGYMLEKCAVCGAERYTDFTDALGHKYELIDRILASNVEDGEETYRCSVCDKTYSVVLLSRLHRFTDLDPNAWYYPYIRTMISGALMNGVSETAFGPNASLTRAMLVTVLYRMQGEPESAPAAFSDVPQDAWYAPAVGWASENGIVNGYPDGTFRPNASVTREQAAKILFNYAPVYGIDNSARAPLAGYADEARISDYARDPLAWATASNILSGFPDSTLQPQGNAARAQIAKMLVSFLKEIAAVER